MIVLLAPDSFKESLSALEVCTYLTKGIHSVNENITVVSNPVSDGGEGILPLLVDASKGAMIETKVHGPLRHPITARYGLIDNGKTAVIEMAEAAGLMLLQKSERNPAKSSTYGVGQLIIQALDKGVNTIIVGLGGSATNDGGSGMLKALGFEFRDNSDRTIKEGNEGLGDLAAILEENVDPRLVNTKFIVASDVTNPLIGPDGATFTYGAQKGANPDDLKWMEENMLKYREVIHDIKGIDVNKVAGSGAAGGLGAAFIAFLDTKIVSGFTLVSTMTNLEEKIKKADVIITGEGKLDRQTLMGKAPAGVATLAKKHNKFLVGIGGLVDHEVIEQLEAVFDMIIPINKNLLSKEESIARAGELVAETGAYIADLIESGDIPVK